MIKDNLQKKIFIETYGCAMNDYDSQLVKAILAKENYTFVQNELEADIVMLNTCAIREHAHRKVYGRIHEIKHKREQLIRKQNPGMPKSQVEAVARFLPRDQNLSQTKSPAGNYLSQPNSPVGQKSDQTFSPAGKNVSVKPVLFGILGCMATNLRTDLLENRSLDIDFIAGPDSYKRLPDLIREAQNTGEKQFDVTLSEFETYSDVLPSKVDGVNALITVMRGCNNFCTFCVVPYTRGRERSRAPENVVEEAKKLADQGVKQITLLGQNVNSYFYENTDFAGLIEAVSKVKGIERIRFTSPHPKDFPDSLLQVIANNPKACKSIHMPLQAGNNRILELMNRTYTKEEFLSLLAKARKLIPQATFTTDVIVGFSSETDAEFEDTLAVMKEAEFDMAFMFKYSERKQTIASRKHPDDVPEAIKTERIVRLNELQKDICLKKNQAHVGKVETVLIEGMATGEKSQGSYASRTDGGILVIVPPGNFQIGDLVPVKITSASPSNLRGEQEINIKNV